MCARHPVHTSMPGAAGRTPVIDFSGQTGSFGDKTGTTRNFTFSGLFGGANPFLTIQIDDGTVASFAPWPAPHGDFWSSTGIVVVTHRVGIATAIYAIARDILAPGGRRIAPSDNLKDDGVALWGFLDPSIQTEPTVGGASRPKL